MSFLSVKRAAEISGSSIKTIRRRIEHNEIAIIYVGRKMFIVGSSFEKWLQRRSIDGR